MNVSRKSDCHRKGKWWCRVVGWSRVVLRLFCFETMREETRVAGRLWWDECNAEMVAAGTHYNVRQVTQPHQNTSINRYTLESERLLSK